MELSGILFIFWIAAAAAVIITVQAEVRRQLLWNNVSGHTTREQPVRFKLATNSIQFYAVANWDKTSLAAVQCTFAQD